MTKQRTPEQEEANRQRSRERQRRYRKERREAAAAVAKETGRRPYRFRCPVCQEPMRTAGGVRRHVIAIHGTVEVTGVTTPAEGSNTVVHDCGGAEQCWCGA